MVSLVSFDEHEAHPSLPRSIDRSMRSMRIAQEQRMNLTQLIRAALYTAVWNEKRGEWLREATYYPSGKGAMIVPGYRLRKVRPGHFQAVRVDDDGLMIEGIDTTVNM